MLWMIESDRMIESARSEVQTIVRGDSVFKQVAIESGIQLNDDSSSVPAEDVVEGKLGGGSNVAER